MNKIKFLREELNLTTREVSALFSLSSSVISKYENEVRDLNTSVTKRLADYFHVTIDYLLCHNDLGLYVYYENSDIKFVITESDYLIYKNAGLIHYKENKRYINANKKLNLPASYDLSKLIDTLASYDDLDGFIENDLINLPVPLNRSTAIKKIITLNDEKFTVIEKMLDIM